MSPAQIPFIRALLQRLLPRRLDRQVMLLVMLLLSLAMPLFALYEARESAGRAVQSVMLQAKALAENVAIISVEPLVTEDFVSIEQLLLRSARFPGVLEIQLTGSDGRVIGDVVTAPGSQPQPRYQLNRLVPPEGIRARIQKEGGKLTIWEPVTGANTIGWVRLTYSLEEADAMVRRYLQDYMFDGTIMLLLLMALIWLVMRRPLGMLRRAAAFAEELKNRGGGHMAVDASSLEVEQLGRALNDASTHLFEQEAAISSALRALNTQKSAMDEHSIVTITDVEGHITYANRKFLDATGYTLEEVLGKNHSIVKSGYHSDAFFQEMWQTIAAGRVWHGEILNHSKSGQDLCVNTTIVPFMDEGGTPYEYVAIRTDITARKRIEQELEEKASTLKQLSGHLEELVRLRTSELVEANRQLRHLNRIKSEFVSMASHELRTPLTSIKSFVEILKEDMDELDRETQRRFLAIIDEESERLGRLINDLLDLQKIESGRVDWIDRPTDLAALLRGSVEFFSKAYGDKGLALRLESELESCWLTLDGDRVKQLVANLLSNALKFTARGEVAVALRAGAGEVRVSVRDTGMGIPEQDLERIFERFYQVRATADAKSGGSGLGLAICREIAAHYGGRIWVESRCGEGSCFSFTLPLAGGVEGS